MSYIALELKLTPKPFLLVAPLLVVMSTTPLPALLPYKAAALAPFNMVTLSISSGLISEMGLP
ncbi:hypothetical protein D3C85_1897080 [compost metagenome]